MDEAPPFWWHRRAWQAWLLSPVSYVYGRIAGRRMLSKPTHAVAVPVICIGNFTAGGAGKTPTTLALAKAIKAAGHKPGFLSRGYGGGITTATVVDPSRHNSHDVGDEPLMLAEVGTTVVSVERPAGADLLVEQGCDFIIMDDGFQNPALEKDYNLVVVDAKRGLGNGHVMPGGPLRAPLAMQLQKTDGVLVIGTGGGADEIIRRTARRGRPVFEATIGIVNKKQWKGKWVLAFAGIADPTKLFDSLKEAGAEIAESRSFGDHHHFQGDECRELLEKAKLLELHLVTTSKDMARLRGRGEAQDRLAEESGVLEVTLKFEDRDMADRIIREAIERFEARKLASAGY